MRILVALLFIALPVSAHGVEGDALDHITAEELALAPGETHERILAFDGEDFTAGWWMLMRGDATQPTRVELFQEGRFITRWTWRIGDNVFAQQLPDDGYLQVRFTNLGDDNGTVRYYYDQTCDCLGKGVAINPGPVWFNIDAQEGEEVTFRWVLAISGVGSEPPENLQIKVDRLQPEDTESLTRLDRIEKNFTIDPAEACYPGGPWNGCFEMTFTAPYTGKQLIWFYANHDGGPEFTVSLPVQVEVEPATETTPLPFWLGLLALLVVRRKK